MNASIIQLDKVIPEPLEGAVSPRSQVWNTQLVFEPSRFYHVSAVSGRGKSTLISLLYGLRHDYTGHISLAGENIRQFSPDQWATHRQSTFAIVFQDLRLFTAYSGRENILVKTDLYGAPDQAAIERMAEVMGVHTLLDKPCGLLSYGERQRIALIRALVSPFRWLLLDEPFSHLDEANVQQAVRLITEACAQRQAGLILTSLGSDSLFHYHQRITL